jgi:transposase-like protein
MAPISYRRHRFPPVVIQHAVWLYLRFTLTRISHSGVDFHVMQREGTGEHVKKVAVVG